MEIPKYIDEPKPGVRDSIRKWEWLLKCLEKGDIFVFNKRYERKCGLCVESSGGSMVSTCHCNQCRFPGPRSEYYRCTGHNREIKVGLRIKLHHGDKLTKKEYTRLVIVCNNMLNALRSIKDGKDNLC